MKLNLGGMHHVTAITSSAKKIYDFYTNVLGLRLVKKTINQDDINTYHLFFADDLGSPGTDITFFDFKGINEAVHGTDEISKTTFRVPNDEALNYWLKRFKHYNVSHSNIETLFNNKIIYFKDFDNQPYALVSDELNKGVKAGKPWLKGPVPNEFAIYGLGPSFINVSKPDSMDSILTDVFFMRKTKTEDKHHLYEMGEGGNGGSIVVVEDYRRLYSYQGYGGVHHIAFRVKNTDEINKWLEHLNRLGAPNSGYVDRFYFESIYTRLYGNILFEIATDEPGFIDDEESYEILGETLALPPKFRDKREYVENIVKPFDTTRSNKTFKKEYFND